MVATPICDPANALNTSAVMFETLFDVDAKFVKLADKECDSISAEIKKWFKKLAVSEIQLSGLKQHPFLLRFISSVLCNLVRSLLDICSG